MTTKSGTPYQQTQAQSSATMDQNFETLMRTLNDQMARLNQNLIDQLAQTNQRMTDQMTHITARLDHLEARAPERTHEDHIELELEPEYGTPINPRRAPRQDLFPEPNPRRPHQDPFYEPNPRRPDPDRIHDSNPRRVYHEPAYEPNPRRPNQDLMDQDDRTLRNIRLEAPTFDGNLDPKVYTDWEGEMDQYFEWYDMTEKRKCKFAKLRLVRQAKLY